MSERNSMISLIMEDENLNGDMYERLLNLSYPFDVSVPLPVFDLVLATGNMEDGNLFVQDYQHQAVGEFTSFFKDYDYLRVNKVIPALEIVLDKTKNKRALKFSKVAILQKMIENEGLRIPINELYAVLGQKSNEDVAELFRTAIKEKRNDISFVEPSLLMTTEYELYRQKVLAANLEWRGTGERANLLTSQEFFDKKRTRLTNMYHLILPFLNHLDKEVDPKIFDAIDPNVLALLIADANFKQYMSLNKTSVNPLNYAAKYAFYQEQLQRKGVIKPCKIEGKMGWEKSITEVANSSKLTKRIKSEFESLKNHFADISHLYPSSIEAAESMSEEIVRQRKESSMAQKTAVSFGVATPKEDRRLVKLQARDQRRKDADDRRQAKRLEQEAIEKRKEELALKKLFGEVVGCDFRIFNERCARSDNGDLWLQNLDELEQQKIERLKSNPIPIDYEKAIQYIYDLKDRSKFYEEIGYRAKLVYGEGKERGYVAYVLHNGLVIIDYSLEGDTKPITYPSDYAHDHAVYTMHYEDFIHLNKRDRKTMRAAIERNQSQHMHRYMHSGNWKERVLGFANSVDATSIDEEELEAFLEGVRARSLAMPRNNDYTADDLLQIKLAGSKIEDTKKNNGEINGRTKKYGTN